MKINNIEPLSLLVLNFEDLEYQRMRVEFPVGIVFWYMPTDNGWIDVGDDRYALEEAWKVYEKELLE